MKKFLTGFGLAMVLLWALSANAAESSLKVSGYVLANYQTWVNDEGKYSVIADGGDWLDDSRRGFNTFDVTRAYLTFQADLGDRFSANVTADIKTDSDNLRRLFLKYAYVDIKNLWPDSKIRFGLQDPPWGSYIDNSLWRYRMVDQAFSNFWGLYPTADFGVGVMGGLLDDKVLYHLAVLNGEGYAGLETDRFKQYTGRLTLDLGSPDTFHISPSVGGSLQDFNDNAGFNYNVFNAGLGMDFLGRVHLAGEYAQGVLTMPEGALPLVKGVWPTGALDELAAVTDPEDLLSKDAHVNFAGGAVYADIKLADQWNLFGRYDNYVPNTDSDFNAQNEWMWTAGICYHPINNLWVTLDYRQLGFGESDPDNDGQDELEPYQIVYTHWKIAY